MTKPQIDGTSLEFQEEACKKYCESNNIEIVKIFQEKGEGAKDLSLNNRQEFLRALEFCRKNRNQIHAFVVLRVNRFVRNTEDHFAVRKILLSYGTTLHSVTEPIGNKPSEKFIGTVLAGATEYENAIRKQQCTDSMSQKINQGLWPWKSPIGYKCGQFKKRGLKKIEPDNPDKQVFLIIQKALKEYAKGIYSQADLAKLLDKWGLKAIRGKKTAPQLVDRMLGKYLKFYAGILVNPWTKEEIAGLHKPMIKKEELYKIWLARSGKANKAKHQRYNPNFPLRRTVICATCGELLTGSLSLDRSKRYTYYWCKNKGCSLYSKSIKKKEVEERFLDYLEKIIPK